MIMHLGFGRVIRSLQISNLIYSEILEHLGETSTLRYKAIPSIFNLDASG